MTTTRERALEAALRANLERGFHGPRCRKVANRESKCNCHIAKGERALALPPSPQPPPGAWDTDSRWPRCIVAYDQPGALKLRRVAEINYADPGDFQLMLAAPDMLAALKYTLHHVIAGLSAGTQPEPQCLAAAHKKLFNAILAADPAYYGRAALARATGAPGDHPEQPAPEHFAHHD